MKRQSTEWKNIFTNTSDKGLIFKTYKTQHQKNNPVKKCAEDLNKNFSKEAI